MWNTIGMIKYFHSRCLLVRNYKVLARQELNNKYRVKDMEAIMYAISTILTVISKLTGVTAGCGFVMCGVYTTSHNQ